MHAVITTDSSMIEIKSRWDDSKILYVAENASDIRDAVDQAVKDEADLSGAYLSGTDLREADLPWWVQNIYDAGVKAGREESEVES